MERQHRVYRALSFALLSLGCHTIIIGSLTLVSWAAFAKKVENPTEYKAGLVLENQSSEQPGGYRFPGSMTDLIDRPASPESRQAVQDLASLLKQDRSMQMSPIDVGETGLKTLAVMELSRSDVVGTGIARSETRGLGLGDRDLAGIGPVGNMWGVGKGQQARSIVYVMDRSGSMIKTFRLLQRELKRSIGSLESDQLLNVIWFNEGKAKQWSLRMRKATLSNKRAAFEAIDPIKAEGISDPMDAVRKGLGFHPDVLFLLSDGDFGQHNRELISMINRATMHNKTIINTILFVGDQIGGGEQTLRSIAEMTHGIYKNVTEQDLGNL